MREKNLKVGFSREIATSGHSGAASLLLSVSLRSNGGGDGVKRGGGIKSQSSFLSLHLRLEEESRLLLLLLLLELEALFHQRPHKSREKYKQGQTYRYWNGYLSRVSFFYPAFVGSNKMRELTLIPHTIMFPCNNHSPALPGGAVSPFPLTCCRASPRTGETAGGQGERRRQLMPFTYKRCCLLRISSTFVQQKSIKFSKVDKVSI